MTNNGATSTSTAIPTLNSKSVRTPTSRRAHAGKWHLVALANEMVTEVRQRVTQAVKAAEAVEEAAD